MTLLSVAVLCLVALSVGVVLGRVQLAREIARSEKRRQTKLHLELCTNGQYSRGQVRELIEQISAGINDGVDGGKLARALRDGAQ